MRRAVFLTVLRWWLGGRINQADQCGVRKATGQMCGMELDKWGDHAVSCKVGPGVIARHNGVNLAWLLAEKAAGYSVQREQKVVFAGKKKPADTLVWGWKGEDACAQDWAVVHPMTKKGLGARKLDPYEAVTQAEERKKRLESSMCADAGVGFVPLAMDTFGGFGPSASEALEVVADQMRTLKGEEDQEKEFRAKRLAQKLRITMFRAMGHQILARASVGRLEEMEAQTEWEEESEEEEEEELTDKEEDEEEKKKREEEEQKKDEEEIQYGKRKKMALDDDDDPEMTTRGILRQLGDVEEEVLEWQFTYQDVVAVLEYISKFTVSRRVLDAVSDHLLAL